ncbi:MAG: beta-ketoacyl-[acyl-carrier-protein] synthase family protein [Candidatus Margulisiibacteriota bacterium]
MGQRRAVITGIGVISPNGLNKEAFWQGIKEGRNCVDRVTSFDASGFPSQIAAEAKLFNPQDYLPIKSIKKMDRSNHLAIVAAKGAITDGEFQINDAEIGRIGVVIGTSFGGVGYAEKEIYKLYTEGLRMMSSYTTTGTFCGGLTGEVSTAFNFRGPSFTVANGCNSSSDSFGLALGMIRDNLADVMLAGGAEACITPGVVGALCRMGVLSAKASRPFARGSDGFVLGEGSWVFILEELEHALQRKAHIYAELLSWASVCKPYGDKGADRVSEVGEAIVSALQKGGLDPEEIDYISAHGSGLPALDEAEIKAIKKVFGQHAYGLAVSSIKSMLGFPLGAGGAAGLAAATLALENNYLPPTINHEVDDNGDVLDYVPNNGRGKKIRNVLSISLDFRSKSSVLALGRYPGNEK